MHTDSPTLSPFTLRIAADQSPGFALRAGSEVFCSQGPLQLRIAPMAGLDGSFGQTLQLASGQSWRAPQDIWIRLASLPLPARSSAGLVHITPAPEKQSRSIRQGLERLWQALRLAGKPRRGGREIRRAQRAA